jgi:hypothetical protein
MSAVTPSHPQASRNADPYGPRCGASQPIARLIDGYLWSTPHCTSCHEEGHNACRACGGCLAQSGDLYFNGTRIDRAYCSNACRQRAYRERHMRESAHDKARRLLVEGRVVVTRVEGTHIDATVRGDSASFYSVRHRCGSWSCTCPALGACSHRLAVQLVTAPSGSWIASPDHMVQVGGRPPEPSPAPDAGSMAAI